MIYQQHLFPRNLKKHYPVVDRAEGLYIWDQQGKRYLDGSGGACVISIGHGVKEIQEAMIEQSSKVSFIHSSHFQSDAANECADLLVEMTADEDTGKVYFLSGGSEAVETAVKLVRQYFRESGKPDKSKIISRWSSFHGNTTGALALGGHTSRKHPYLPLLLYTPHIETCYCYRCGLGQKPETCNLECANQLERSILHEGPENVAAFISEPVIGATAGAVVPKEGYFKKIREICDTYDVKLIADEVMTGVGRTGKNFCMDHWEVTPDVTVVAKGLSSGYTPLGAIIVKDEIYDMLKAHSGVFIHGHTYCQNPLSVAIGAAVLKYIKANNLVDRSAAMGAYLLDKLHDLKDIDIVGDIRGLGLFAGIEFVKDKKTKAWFDRKLKVNEKIASDCFKNGLITYPGGGGIDGFHGDHILLAPPFIITEEEIDEMVDMLEKSILKIQKTL